MRIAILADIHANLPALEAVLADVAELKPDLVVVNGDLINRGPSNRAVIERLWDFSPKGGKGGFWFTLGNHDDLVLKWAQNDPSLADLYSDSLFASTGWAADQLEQAHLDWINNLPFQVIVEDHPGLVYGLDRSDGLGQKVQVRITHGSPRHYREGYDEHQSLGVLGEIAEDYPARLLIGSHTHRSFMYQLGDSLVLNSSAVGAPFNGDTRAQYMLVELGENHVQVDFRQIPYNLDLALQDFYTSGLLAEGGLGAHLFWLELQQGRSFLTPFYLWALEQKLPRDWETWQMFQRVYPERFAKR